MSQNLSSEVRNPIKPVSERDSIAMERTYIVRHQMCVILLGETFPKEIAEVTKNDEHEVADVRSDQDVVRGFLYLVFVDRFVGVVLRNAAIALVSAVTEFRVNCVENLFRSRRGAGIREVRAVVV